MLFTVFKSFHSEVQAYKPRCMAARVYMTHCLEHCQCKVEGSSLCCLETEAILGSMPSVLSGCSQHSQLANSCPNGIEN